MDFVWGLVLFVLFIPVGGGNEPASEPFRSKPAVSSMLRLYYPLTRDRLRPTGYADVVHGLSIDSYNSTGRPRSNTAVFVADQQGSSLRTVTCGNMHL
jgi:hypothetical protein